MILDSDTFNVKKIDDGFEHISKTEMMQYIKECAKAITELRIEVAELKVIIIQQGEDINILCNNSRSLI